jgi:nicotinamide-nucleotide amidase
VTGSAAAEQVIQKLAEAGLTIAVAESLTGGLVTAKLTSVPGASAVVLGGVVAYNTELKRLLLGVDATLLAEHGAVHADVAAQMAANVRSALAVDGRAADVGIATTGVAGPETQDGKPVGTVFVGFAFQDDVVVTELHLSGNRAAIRKTVVSETLLQLLAILHSGESSQDPRE